MIAPAGAFDGVVLAGGRARRLGGVDKQLIEVGGTSLLVAAVDALSAAGRIVAVGPRRGPDLLPAGVAWTTEEPPGGGPAAAVAAGLELVSAPIVVVLGADLPSIDAPAVATLVAGLTEPGTDAALAVDDSEREQYLCAAYRTDRLRTALEAIGELAGSSMHAVLSGLKVARLPLGAKAADIDTPEDLERFSSEGRRSRSDGGRG